MYVFIKQNVCPVEIKCNPHFTFTTFIHFGIMIEKVIEQLFLSSYPDIQHINFITRIGMSVLIKRYNTGESIVISPVTFD